MAESEEHDVVVVGSGAAAMCGAWAAARAGLETVVLERTALLGGTSAYSGAACWLPGSDLQQAAGLPDSTEGARAYLRAVLGEETRDKQDAFLDTAPEMVRALSQDPALVFAHRPFPDYFDAPGRVPGGRSIMPADLEQSELGDLVDLLRPAVDRDRAGRGHGRAPLSAGRALIGRFLLALTATGVGSVHTRHDVTELITDESGRVTGVVAQTPDGPRRVHARRGVLLAAGGFERDAQTRRTHGVPGDADWSMAPAGSTSGGAMHAAERVGAATALMDEAWWAPGVAGPDGTVGFAVGFHGGLVVDAHGRRFANESLPYDQFGRAMAADADRVPAYALFDSRTAGRFPAFVVPTETTDDQLAAGTWVTADTLPELAERAGLPVAETLASVERFNGFAASGRDEDFGRGQDEFDRFFADPVLVPLDQPPYVAARLVLADLGTKGGLVTDTEARVLRADGSVIDGLFAAGNTAASWTGSAYPGPGIPIGSGMVAAWRAVAELAADS